MSVTVPIMSANAAAYPTNPIPIASPVAIDKNIAPISFAVPGTERNLTSPNVPATATPAPTLPFTKSITILTTAGNIASVTTKLCEYLLL